MRWKVIFGSLYFAPVHFLFSLNAGSSWGFCSSSLSVKWDQIGLNNTQKNFLAFSQFYKTTQHNCSRLNDAWVWFVCARGQCWACNTVKEQISLIIMRLRFNHNKLCCDDKLCFSVNIFFFPFSLHEIFCFIQISCAHIINIPYFLHPYRIRSLRIFFLLLLFSSMIEWFATRQGTKR